MADLESLYEAILKGKLDVAKAVTTEAIAENVDPQEIINGYMSRAMEDIGKRFEEGKAFVPELLMAARAMKGALDLLKPLMKGAASHRLGKVVIGTVKGDLHDIGKNLVASMLEGCGFEVINLGTDISSESLSFRLADHDDELYAGSDRRPGKDRYPPGGEGHDWRCPCIRIVCPSDWSRRLQR